MCFGRARSGSITILFAISLVALLSVVGASIDLANAFVARQKLSQVAVMACQYANRSAIVQNAGTDGTTYKAQATQFIANSITQQGLPYAQTTATPFNFTVNGAATVSLSASVPTAFMKVARITSIPISVTMPCYSTPSVKAPQRGDYVLQENFNTTITTWSGNSAFYRPDGTQGVPTTSTPSSFTSAVAYTGTSGVKWNLTGYCVEQEKNGYIAAASPNGMPVVELDCDNGSGTGGNSSISTVVTLAAGTYELRYFYVSHKIRQLSAGLRLRELGIRSDLGH